MASRKLTVEFLGDTAGLEKSLARANARLRKFEGQTRSTNDHVGVLGAGLKRAAGAAAGMAAGFASIHAAKDAVDTTEELGHATLKLHKNFGLSIQSASEFAAVMKARGVDAKQGAQAFKTLASQVSGAEQGSKGAIGTFKLLGISVGQLKGKDFAQQLALVSDGLKNAGPGVDKVTAASKLLGRGWQSLTPLLAGGSAALQRQLELADKYGATLGGKTVKEVERMVAAQREQKLAMLGIQVSLGSLLLPLVAKGTEAFSKFVLQFREGTGTGGKFRDKLTEIWQSAKPTVDTLISLGRSIGTFAAKHPAVLKLAASMAAVGLAIKGIRFAGNITGLSTFLGAAKAGALKFIAIWRGAGTLAGTSASTNLGSSLRYGMGAAIMGTKAKVVSAFAKLGAAGGAAMAAAAALALPALVALVLNRIGNAVKHALDPKDNSSKFGGGGNAPNAWDSIKSLFGLAAGGPIMGGTPGKDSVPAMLMPGEHVLTSKEVRNAGGHGAIFAMRRALGGGGQSRGGMFAAGGGVLTRMQSFADGVASKHLPYVYGGSGGNAYDCSGFVSAILNAGGFSVGRQDTNGLRNVLAPGAGKYITVGVRGGAGRTGHTMIRVGSKYYESGGGHGPARDSGWNGTFDLYHPRNEASAVMAARTGKAAGNTGVGNPKKDNKRPAMRGFKPTGSSFIPSTAESRYQLALTTPGAGDDLWAANAGWTGANAEVKRVAAAVRAGTAPASALSAAIARRDEWNTRVNDATTAGGNPMIAANIGGALYGDTSATASPADAVDNTAILTEIRDFLKRQDERAHQFASTNDNVFAGWAAEILSGRMATSATMSGQVPSTAGMTARL